MRLQIFLRDDIRSLWTLELLLLLYRHPERRWSIEQANRELRASPYLIETRLEELERKGLAARDGAYWRYAPRSDDLRDTVAHLSSQFRERPFAIVNVIFSAQDWRLDDDDVGPR